MGIPASSSVASNPSSEMVDLDFQAEIPANASIFLAVWLLGSRLTLPQIFTWNSKMCQGELYGLHESLSLCGYGLRAYAQGPGELLCSFSEPP